jgi:hypothetical protein
MTQSPLSFSLEGGLDMVTPVEKMPPGRAIDCLNYEPTSSGYRRLIGFERYDGSVSPSSTLFYRYNFTAGLVAGLAAGDRFFNGPNLGVVIAITVTSGSFGAGNAAGYFIAAMYAIPATTASNGITQYPTHTTRATRNGAPAVEPSTPALIAAAPALIRASIIAVPGSGPVRAVFEWDGDMYAIRDNAGGTAGVVNAIGPAISIQSYAPFAGWSSIFPTYEMAFTEGGKDTLVKPTMGVAYSDISNNLTPIWRINKTSGEWESGTAAGYIYLNSAMPSWTAGEYLGTQAAPSTRIFRVTATPSLVALPASGTYHHITHNFYGADDLKRAYFVSGGAPAFEVGDYPGGAGIQTAPIHTGMPVDTPTRISEYRNHLFLSFPGGSVQFSAPGQPLTWNAIVGAGEIGIGDDAVDFINIPNALGILGEESIHVLYGHNISDFQLDPLTRDAGALPHTAQHIGRAIYMDNRGVRSLDATQAWGNFTTGAVSIMISPFLEAKRRASIEPVASWVSRTGTQYWVIFEDGTGFVIYLGKKYPEAMLFDLGITVTCATSTEDDGVERIFVGADNGFVYELNKGTSFDGAAIPHYIQLPYNAFSNPESDKQVHHISAELETPGEEVSLNVTLSYNDGEESTSAIPMDIALGAVQPATGQRKGRASADPDGLGKNVSAKFSGETADEKEHTLRSVTYRVSLMNTLA